MNSSNNQNTPSSTANYDWELIYSSYKSAGVSGSAFYVNSLPALLGDTPLPSLRYFHLKIKATAMSHGEKLNIYRRYTEDYWVNLLNDFNKSSLKLFTFWQVLPAPKPCYETLRKKFDKMQSGLSQKEVHVFNLCAPTTGCKTDEDRTVVVELPSGGRLCIKSDDPEASLIRIYRELSGGDE